MGMVCLAVRSKAAQSAAGEPCSDSESVCSSEGSGQSHSSRGIGRTHGAKDSKYISRSYGRPCFLVRSNDI